MRTTDASAPALPLRPLAEADLAPAAALWYQGWRDAHLALLPAELIRLRTPESFADRLLAAREHCRVVGLVGGPTGFVRIEGDELDQFYVLASARGTGLAYGLMAATEALMRESGTTRAWLACAIGNDRAARFYARCGWANTGVRSFDAETSAGPFAHDVWRFEKNL
jgi:GNAT superfamily N-acetyltransferase